MYDELVLKIICNADYAYPSANAACCLQRKSEGGFCFENGTDGSSFSVFAMENYDFEEWADEPEILSDYYEY